MKHWRNLRTSRVDPLERSSLKENLPAELALGGRFCGVVIKMKRYSKPATDFQVSIHNGALFRVLSDLEPPVPHAGHILTIRGVIKETKNPDDCLYRVIDNDDIEHKVRAWWLRHYCARVD